MTPIGIAVAARLAAARQSQDHSTLLTAEAATDALALLRQAAPAPGDEIDTAALADVFLTFFLRGQMGETSRAADGPAIPDLVIASLVGGLLFERAPQLLPDPVRNELASVNDPIREARFAYVVAAAHAGAAVPDGDAPADLQALDRALAWSGVCCQAVADRTDPTEVADALVQRIVLLSGRFRLAGDLDALEEAAAAGMRVSERLSPAHPAQAAYLPVAAEAVVASAYALARPSVDEAERVVAGLPPGTATETTTQMLDVLRAVRSESGSATWPGEPDLRMGVEFRQLGMRTGHPGLLAAADRRLRAALAQTPPGHPLRDEITIMLGTTLLELGTQRDELELVQEGMALLCQSGRFVRGLAAELEGTDIPAETVPAAAVVDILFRTQSDGVLDGAAAITDEWLADFTAAVGRLPAQHPQRNVYASLLAAVTSRNEDVFANVLLAAVTGIDWARLATELGETGRAPILAAVFESMPGQLDMFAALLQAVLDDRGHDAPVEPNAAMPASDASADGTDRPATPSAVLDSLLSVITDPMQVPAWDQETRLAAAALLAGLSSPGTDNALGGQGTDGRPGLEEAVVALGEFFLAGRILTEDSEASQLDRLTDIGERMVAAVGRWNPAAGEHVKVMVEAFLSGTAGAVRTIEAIPQGRAVESRADTIAEVRRRIDELPADHSARNLLQAQLVLLLAAQAAALRDSDPGRARELLAEATALADSVSPHQLGPVAAMLRQALDHNRALVEHTEPVPLPGMLSEEARDRLRRAGDGPEAFRQMLADQAIPVWRRMIDGFGVAFDVTADGRVEQGLACAEQVVDLLAEITDRGTDAASAEHTISMVSPMPSTYVSALLTMLHLTSRERTLSGPLVDRAAALAERSRGLLLARELEGRTDLGELRSAHPDLASRFEALTSQLAADPDTLAALCADDGPPATGRAEWARLRKFRASRDLDALIEQIRADDTNFRDFLRPLTADQLRGLAAQGPVVLFTYPSMPQPPGSPPVLPCALVVTGRTIISVCLPVPPAQVAEAAGRWSAAVADINARGAERPGVSRLREAAADMTDTLSWTWHTVVGPVLHAAGLPSGPGWPRVWWIPDGPFHALPLHAAQCPASGCALGGPDRRGCGGAALDAVVSSYVPGFRTLAHARRRADGSAASAGRPLLVAADDDELPGAEAAVREAAARLGADAPLVGRAATREVVVTALRNVSHAHFGCHAASDPAAPSGSVLHLPGGDQLTVREICRARPHAARLVFLSACSTARTSQRLASEAIHLSSAFLIAGFGEAVGTLWEIDSRDAYQVTTDFYQQITGRPPQGAAVALHQCVRALRREHPDTPHIWAAYVHAGA